MPLSELWQIARALNTYVNTGRSIPIHPDEQSELENAVFFKLLFQQILCCIKCCDFGVYSLEWRLQ